MGLKKKETTFPMAFEFATFIPVERISTASIQHRWDDWDPYPALGKSDPETMAVLEQLSDRAIIAYSIACAEWVVARFSRVSRDEHPPRFLEACWAFEMDKHFAAPPPNKDDEWKGQIRGPLDMAMVTVLNTYYTTEDGVGEIEGAFNERVVLHVLASPETFLEWRGTVLRRLRRLYARDSTMHWGNPVPREALDPQIPLESTDFGGFVQRFLSLLDPAANPLLRRIQGDNSK